MTPEAERDYRRAYYRRNKRRMDAQHRIWVEANQEKQREYARRYARSERARGLAQAQRARNPDAVRAADRARHAKRDKVAHAEATRSWRQRHPERYRDLKRMAEARRRARRLDAFVEDVEPSRLLVMHDGLCGICGLALGPDFHVDHIVPLARGGEHSYANTQPAHPACNARKGVHQYQLGR